MSPSGSNGWHQKTEQQLLTRPVLFAAMEVMENCSDLVVYIWSEEKSSLHCVKQNIFVLLWYPRHGDVLHLLTPTTLESAWAFRFKAEVEGKPIMSLVQSHLSILQIGTTFPAREIPSNRSREMSVIFSSDGHLASKTGSFKKTGQ